MRRIGPLATALAVVPLLAFGPAERAAPTHWALIVGITDYIHFDDVEGGDLPGAENDARGMRDVLVARYGFPEANVRMILNHDATRENIRAGIEWLQESVSPGDNVVFYFAGHGSQVWDESGDEADGLDETIAPADVDPESPEYDILDDDLGEWLRAVPGNNLIYIHDNCNAGTGTRDVTPFSRARRLGRDVSALERPESVSRRAMPGQDEDESGMDLDAEDVLELAAAQPNQAAVDALFEPEGGAESFHGGAFTTFLLRQLWRAPADATYEDVFRSVDRELEQHRFQQDPHISSEVSLASAPLFFVEGRSASGAAFVPVAGVSGREVELTAGGAMGLTVGSVLESADGDRIEVTSVTRDRARARIVSGELAPGDRTTLVGYTYPESRLRVNVAAIGAESSRALEAALPADAPIDLVEGEDDFAHLLIRRRGTELRVVGQDGFLRHRAPSGEAAAELADELVMEASSMQLASLDNPGQTFEVEVGMEGGRTTFGIGESLSFHATSERDGYLTLVDLGTDGTVVVLFPNPYDRENRIQAGETLRFPTESSGSEIQALPPAGRGTVRAFVTPEPLDIPIGEEYLTGHVELADLIATALKRAAGELEGSEAVRLDSWASASLIYEITN